MDSSAKSFPLQIVQLTDTHLYGVPHGTLLKMNTQDSLDHVVEMASSNEEHVDLILATGDIAQDASVPAYKKFIDSVSPLNAPFYWIPGNHDVATVMKEVAGDESYCQKSIQLQNWLMIMLDTSIVGQVHGRLEPEELDFLEQRLLEAEKDSSVEHCLICLHHNPVPANAAWMKDIGLHNHEAFFEIVSQFNKVNSIVYGHIHQELDFDHSGIRCFCTPSTCIQFKPKVTNFELDNINPGYRSFSLFEDGSIESKVYRVTGTEFEVDLQSDGY